LDIERARCESAASRAKGEGGMAVEGSGLRTMFAGVMLGAGLASFTSAPTALPARAEAAICQRSDFEAVVDEAAAALRTLNQANRPHYQAKLRQLAAKRGWTLDQLTREGVELVRDQTITDFDQRSSELLERISGTSGVDRDGKTPDCRVLAEIRGHLRTLIETQRAKWAYMLEKVERELAR
jgi:hypothetical protein